MKVLLDAKDLIKLVEHSKPISPTDMRLWLNDNGAQLLYSLENIRALAGPLSKDRTQLARIVSYLDELENMPHCFIAANIEDLELREAAKSFDAKREYQPIDPFVTSFSQVFPPLTILTSTAASLADTVTALWLACPPIFGPRPILQEIHANAMNEDRNRLQAKGHLDFRFPREAVAETFADKLRVPPKHASKIATWIASNSSRCPSLWLIRAMGAVMARDLRYSSRSGDVFDMSDTMFTPYVDYATLDRTIVHYFGLAIQLLVKEKDRVIERKSNVFKGLSELLTATTQSRDNKSNDHSMNQN